MAEAKEANVSLLVGKGGILTMDTDVRLGTLVQVLKMFTICGMKQRGLDR